MQLKRIINIGYVGCLLATSLLVPWSTVFGQMPIGTEEAIKAASSTGRYEPIVLVVVMLVVTSFLVYIVKAVMTQAVTREVGLNARISQLEDSLFKEVLDCIKANTQAMLQHSVASAEQTKAIMSLSTDLRSECHACFMLGDHQQTLVETIADRVVKEVRLQSVQSHE